MKSGELAISLIVLLVQLLCYRKGLGKIIVFLLFSFRQENGS